MGAQTNGDSTFPRQRQIANEREQQERSQQQAMAERMQQQRSQQPEQEVGIDNYGREQQQRAQQQAMNERMQQQAMAERMQQQRAENTPTPGSGIAFGPGRSNRGDVDLRRLLQDRMTRGN